MSAPTPKLQEYDECLDFLVYPDGYRAILPNEWDVAAQFHRVQQAEQKLTDFEAEDTPPEVARYENVLARYEGYVADDETAKPSKEEYERADGRVAVWERSRIGRRMQFQAERLAAQRELAAMEEYPLGVEARKQFALAEGAELVTETYHMRLFTHRERLQAEEEYSDLDEQTHLRIPRVNERNVALLKHSLLHEVTGSGKVEYDRPDEQLGDTVCAALIGRMWGRTAMSDALRTYFRHRRQVAGRSAEAPGDAAGSSVPVLSGTAA